MRFALLAVLALSAPAAALPVFVPRLDAEGFPLPRECVRRLGSARILCGYCTQLAYSADGKTVFAGGAGVSAWDVATGKCRWRDSGAATVHSLAVSADGKTVWATASKPAGKRYEGRLLKVEAATGTKLLERKIADSYIRESRVSTTGRALVFNHSLIEVFDADKDKPIYTCTRPDGLAAMWAQDLSADGERLLLGESDAEGKSRRSLSVAVATGKTVHEWKPGTHGGCRYGPTPDTLTVTVGGAHHTPDTGRQNRPMMLTHWDLKAGKELRAMPVAPSGVPTAERFAYSPDGTRAVLVVNGVPVLFDTPKWTRVREFDALRQVACVCFSPDGNTLAVGGRGLAFVDVATGKLLHGSAPLAEWSDDFHFADGGRSVVCGYGIFGQLRYDVQTGKRTLVPDDGPTDLTDYQHVVRDREGLRQAKNVLDTTADIRRGAIELHAVGQPNVVRELPSSGESYYQRLDFTPGGRYLIGMTADSATLWNAVAGGKPIHVRWQHPGEGGASSGYPRAFACPQDRLVATHDTNRINGEAGTWAVGIHELATGKQRERLTGPGLMTSRIEWAGNGTRFAFGGSRTTSDDGAGFVSVYDMTGRRYLMETATDVNVRNALALSVDGRTVAVPGRGGIELREVATGGVRRSFTTGSVSKIAPHPDGRRFATESATDGVLLWDSLSSPAAWPKEADALWAALGGEAAPAHAAIRTLVANPAKAIPLLKAKMDEVKPLPAERIAALVARLGDKEFATRDAATKELLEHLDDAKPALKTLVADAAANAEAKARAAKLLTQVPPNAPGRLRVLRAVEAAELVATADAIFLLRAWSAGTGFRATEATAALSRLKR